ncbi:unnamed protein product [Sphagnum tenellum]
MLYAMKSARAIHIHGCGLRLFKVFLQWFFTIFSLPSDFLKAVYSHAVYLASTARADDINQQFGLAADYPVVGQGTALTDNLVEGTACTGTRRCQWPQSAAPSRSQQGTSQEGQLHWMFSVSLDY